MYSSLYNTVFPEFKFYDIINLHEFSTKKVAIVDYEYQVNELNKS